MESLIEIFDKFGLVALVPLVGLALVGIQDQSTLYDKCGLPRIDCVIPVKNVITFLKIMGRPAGHSLFVILPPPFIIGALLFLGDPALQYGVAALFFIPWAYFMTRVYIELCQSFGHYKLTDYILCVALNGFYVLHLGLSYSEKYKGPVYQPKTEESELEGQVAS